MVYRGMEETAETTLWGLSRPLVIMERALLCCHCFLACPFSVCTYKQQTPGQATDLRVLGSLV